MTFLQLPQLPSYIKYFKQELQKLIKNISSITEVYQLQLLFLIVCTTTLLLIPLEFLQLAKTASSLMKIIYRYASYGLNVAFISVLLLLNTEFLLSLTETKLSLEGLLKALLGDGIFKGKVKLENEQNELTIEDLNKQ